MAETPKYPSLALLRQFVLGLFCAAIGYAVFLGHHEWIIPFVSLGTIFLLVSSDLRKLCKWGSLLLLGYVLFSGLTLFWVMSGKFFLREYSKIYMAVTCFLLAMLKGRDDAAFGRELMSIMACVAACIGAFSIAMATTDLYQHAFFLPQILRWHMFERGTRLAGLMDNANTLAAALALGMLFSIVLLSHARCRAERIAYSIYLGINAFTFILCFSMGATGCFAASLVVYLIFEDKSRRSATLARMLEGAIPSVIFSFIAFPLFDRTGPALLLPLLLLAANIVVIELLEERLSGWLTERLEKLPRAGFPLVILAVVLFIVAAYHLTGPYTFGDSLRRSAYLNPGEHTLAIEADGDVSVSIVSQSREQAMMHTETPVYSGPAAGAVFTVPEHSVVCYFTFSAQPGTTLSRAAVDGATALRLKYRLLPGSIANRLQGLWANQNLIQRGVFFDDGMKLFQRHPVIGNSVGFFELGVASVQSFYYESKYVHNHYIQVLLEDGIVGLLLYAGALLATVISLIKNRKKALASPVGGFYAALTAALAMGMLHSIIEISMSSIFFLCMIYVTLGLINRYYADSILPAPAESAAPGGKKPAGILPRIICGALALVFTLSVFGHLYAQKLAAAETETPEEYARNIETAIRIDPYGRDGYKLSFINTIGANHVSPCYSQADLYAAELSEKQSNTTPRFLVYYYLQTHQYDKAVRAAMSGAAHSASDARVWNNCIAMLASAFTGRQNSPLIHEGATLIPLLTEYRQLWLDRNAAAMEPVVLEPDNLRFFEIVEALGQTEAKPDQISAILSEAQAS